MSSPTIGEAVRAFLVSLNLVGERVYRDRAPDGAQTPFITFIDPISDAPQLIGDRKTIARRRLVHLSLWSDLDASDVDTIVPALQSGLDGGRLDCAVTTYSMRVTDLQTLVEGESRMIHNPITVQLTHA